MTEKENTEKLEQRSRRSSHPSPSRSVLFPKKKEKALERLREEEQNDKKNTGNMQDGKQTEMDTSDLISGIPLGPEEKK